MKTFIKLFFLLTVAVFTSCMKDNCYEKHTFQGLTPVYMSYQDLRSSVKSTSPRQLEQPGKIFYKGNYIFINEKEKGIHIINNSNPSAPLPVSFINIPGNGDLAVQNNILYADSYIDLLAIDISNPEAVKVVKRIENIFPYDTKGTYKADTAKGVVIDTKTETITDEFPCNGNPGGFKYLSENGGFAPDAASSFNGNVPTQGKGGSMARLTIMQGFLYYVDEREMHLINISNASNPVYSEKVNVGVDIETIFPYDKKLFIGSRTGMHIFDNSTPSNPVKMSFYSHIRNCDPVVVQGDYAYVTIRSGNNCGGNINRMEVVDITDPYKPFLKKSYDMINPHGLSINKDVLFICEGKSGLKMLNANDPMDVKLVKHNTAFDTYDVISLEKLAMVIGQDGLYQFSYNQDFELQQLSKIPIYKP